jgi:hypothetical protein
MPPRRSSLSLNQRLTIFISILAIGTTIIAAFISGHDWFGLFQRKQETELIGRVLDDASQRPIPGAKVSFDMEGVSPIVYTDSEGVYLLKVMIDSERSGQIRVDADGYDVYTRNITVFPELGTIQEFRLSQLPYATLVPTLIIESPIATPTSTPRSVATNTSRVFATVSPDIYIAGLRRSPGYVGKDAIDIIVEIAGGQIVEILGEKLSADSILWWKVSWNGYTGWIADHTTTGKVILIFNP